MSTQQPASPQPPQPPPSSPVIVRIVETPHDPTGLSEVFIGALGLTGAIVVLALIAAVIFAGVLFWIRSRSV